MTLKQTQWKFTLKCILSSLSVMPYHSLSGITDSVCKILMSDQGPQFARTSRRKALIELGIQTQYSSIMHHENNPTERIMLEFGNYFQTYCHTMHRKWPEQVSYIQQLLNA
jgi:hypothetical protein